MNRFTGKISADYKKANKSEIQAALTANSPAGTCEALCNEYYGEIIVCASVAELIDFVDKNQNFS
ncbi:MAG: hypothetical protein II857_10470 [Selenomonadaceae bacterium]|nr:hypothetical protein [Selenomonadaceae bacterium]